MKRMLALMLMLAVALMTLSAWAEDVPVTGDWYADMNGVPAQLTLKEDGGYVFTAAGKETKQGRWELREGYIYFDGSGTPDLYTVGELLRLGDAPVFFDREQPAVYVPAEPLTDAEADDLAGYWKSAYVDLNGAAVPARARGDRTDLYVEGTSAILGGPVLGDRQVKLTMENGALVCDAEGTNVCIARQADGYLRLTVTGDSTQTWYLTLAHSPALDALEEQAE